MYLSTAGNFKNKDSSYQSKKITPSGGQLWGQQQAHRHARISEADGILSPLGRPGRHLPETLCLFPA